MLKLNYQGELRRVRLPDDVKFEDIREGIQKAFANVDLGTICMKYIDEDGDRCTLCPATLSDCVAHAVEISGQKVVKLELETHKLEHHVDAAPTAPAADALYGSCPAAVDGNANMQEGWENMTKYWAQVAEQWKGYAAEMNGSTANCYSDNSKWNQDWVLKPKKMVWVLSRLRASGTLNSKTVASMVVSFLPRLIANLPLYSDKVDWKLAKKMGHLRPVLKDLTELVSRTPGLEQCEAKLNAVAQDTAPASEALSALCIALDGLPFDAKINFVEEFYNSQENNINQLLGGADEWMPFWAESSLEHASVTCDGCNMHPLKGPRFKCMVCANYDLCGECFARKSSANGGEHADHEFKCIVADWGACKKRKGEPFFAATKAMKGLFGKGMGCKGKGKWMPWEREGFEGMGCKGNGEGKCGMKGKGKGKLFGKGWWGTW